MDNNINILLGLLETSRKLGADAADGMYAASAEHTASQRLGKPEDMERSESKVIGLRVFCGRQQAIVSSTDLSSDALHDLAERAIYMARATPADPNNGLADAGLLAQSIPELDLLDDDEPDVAWLNEQCKVAEEAAMSVAGISNSEGAQAQYRKGTVCLAALSDNINFAHGYHNSLFSLSVSVLAGKDTGMERDYDFATKRHRADMPGAETIGINAAKRTLARLNPRKAATCTVPVIFDSRVSRELVGIFAGAISGNSIARGASFLKDHMEEMVFNDSVSIMDDPHIIRGLASKPFDAEGVKNEKRLLLDRGILKSWILDTRTAGKLGLVTTGHASRSAGGSPSPSATNIYMQNGKLSPKSLMGDIKNGFYVTETFGMGVNIITGDFSQGASGFWIENGEIAYPVSEITIAGKLKDMFSTLTPANDLEFRYSANAPTVRIDAMTIAGV